MMTMFAVEDSNVYFARVLTGEVVETRTSHDDSADRRRLVLIVEDLNARQILRDCTPFKSLRRGPGAMQVIILEYSGAKLTHDEIFTDENYQYILREGSPLKSSDRS